jgi:hypothetical protein
MNRKARGQEGSINDSPVFASSWPPVIRVCGHPFQLSTPDTRAEVHDRQEPHRPRVNRFTARAGLSYWLSARVRAGLEYDFALNDVTQSSMNGQPWGTCRALPSAPRDAQARQPVPGATARPARLLRHDAAQRPRAHARREGAGWPRRPRYDPALRRRRRGRPRRGRRRARQGVPRRASSGAGGACSKLGRARPKRRAGSRSAGNKSQTTPIAAE